MSPEVLAADIAQHNVASTTPLGRDLVARTRRPSSPPVPIVASCPLAGASRQHLVVVAFESVSYTHLDVYKRQTRTW